MENTHAPDLMELTFEGGDRTAGLTPRLSPFPVPAKSLSEPEGELEAELITSPTPTFCVL